MTSDENKRHLRFEIGEERSKGRKIALEPIANTSKVSLKADFLTQPVIIEFPKRLILDGKNISVVPQWNVSAAGSIWFEQNIAGKSIGGRLTSNEQDVDMEFWVENRRDDTVTAQAIFRPELAETIFADKQLERSFILVDGEWKFLKGVEGSDAINAELVAVLSKAREYTFAIGWAEQEYILDEDAATVASAVDMPKCPTNRRSYIYGKMFLLEGTLEDLHRRFLREVKR